MDSSQPAQNLYRSTGKEMAVIHRMGLVKQRVFPPYVDDASLVSKHQVPEEAGLAHLLQVDHVVHALRQRRVHDPEGRLQLLGEAVLLEGGGPAVSETSRLAKRKLNFELRPCLPSPHRPPVDAGRMT